MIIVFLIIAVIIQTVATDCTARLATGEEVELLELTAECPVVLQQTRKVSLEDGRIIEVCEKVTRGDRAASFALNFS